MALEPANTRGRFLLASILVRAGRCADGAEHLEKIIAAEPSHTESVSLLARAYLCAGRADEAARVRQRFAELAKGDQAARENRVQSDHLVREAAEHARGGRPNEALALLQRALKQDPESDAAYTLLAKIHYSAGHYDVAREAVDLALKHNPYRSDALYVRGRILAKQDDLPGRAGRAHPGDTRQPPGRGGALRAGPGLSGARPAAERHRGAREGRRPGARATRATRRRSRSAKRER